MICLILKNNIIFFRDFPLINEEIKINFSNKIVINNFPWHWFENKKSNNYFILSRAKKA